MIQVFKKIRQKLIQEKRLRNYVIYAIGEILLVVIGILLALQFSNWNEKRQEVQKEIWYLDNLANDMFNQKDGLQELQEYFTETLKISEDLLRDYKEQKDYTKIDSLSHKLNMLMITYIYPKVDNTYRELISSGRVSLIENDDLLNDIIDFYLAINEIEILFQVNEKQVFYGEVYPVLNKYAEIDLLDYSSNEDFNTDDKAVQDYIITQLKLPKVKLELTNAIKNKIIIVSDYLENVKIDIEEIEKLITRIDDEIKSLE